ncbi:MAG: hypothetical protein NVSMB55_27930 [Mycobacteriales bacterium]
MRHSDVNAGRMAPRGGGAGRARPEQDLPATDGIEGWFTGRLPEGWFDGPPQVTADRDEILVVGRIPAPEAAADAEATAATTAAVLAGRVTRVREDTREARMRIAREAEHRFGRKVAWGAEAGEHRELFTTLSVPVMTRLRQPERQVLDTLVDAGVARSRSEALAWCVKLVGRNTDSWLAELRTAMESVQQVRERGPA